jgi:molecular chaperone HscB
MSDDPFALLGLPRRFAIDAAQLQSAWLRRTAALHPDRIADPMRQAEAARNSARINDARNALHDDEQRANVLLSLLGGPAKEQDKSLPDGFLMDILDVRQRLEEAQASRDEAELRKFEQWADEQRSHYISQLIPLFDEASAKPAPAPAPAPGVLRAIRQILNAWRYIERMREQVRPE